MDEAQAWVEYCNGTGNTHWASLRRAHGHPEPYRVRYWGLGNEMYGSWQIGHLSPEDYVKKARAFALVMPPPATIRSFERCPASVRSASSGVCDSSTSRSISAPSRFRSPPCAR